MVFIRIFLVLYYILFSSICLAEKASDKSSTIGQLIPPGTMLYYAGCKAAANSSCNDSDSKKELVPEGWIKAYGQAVSRSAYPKLFAAIGTTYGLGDGSTTFNLPDCRGRAAVGRDNMGGSTRGLVNLSGQDGRGGAVGNFATVIGGSGGSSSPDGIVSTTASTSYLFPKHYHGFDLRTDSNGAHTHSFSIPATSGSHRHYVAKDACSVSDPDMPFTILGTQCSSPTYVSTTDFSGYHAHSSSSFAITAGGAHIHSTISGSIGTGSINGDANSTVTTAGHTHVTTGSVVQPSIIMNCIIKY